MKRRSRTVIKIKSFLHWHHDGNYYNDIEYDLDYNVLRFNEYKCAPTPEYASLGVFFKSWLKLIKKEGWLQKYFYTRTMEWFFVGEKVCTYSGYMDHCENGQFVLLNPNSRGFFVRKEVTLGIVCKRETSSRNSFVCKWSDKEKFQLVVDLKGGLILNGAYLKHTESRKLRK
jgi:hypothetical protein